ncbi:MAG: ABC transporter ATP-binding protein [Verrucomicrobia bacterium]|nr:ABC transporter ATP-binding protein [Verrucomicrobiota bacterium]MCH8526968.1 ATP-binding cassette domain-containing protein [Kiritimatiellia bacterium]
MSPADSTLPNGPLLKEPHPDTRSADPAAGEGTLSPLLSVRGLCKYFPVKSKGLFQKQVGEVRAADGITFDLMPGETLGLVGESGCGKTTTGRTILRALEPTSGEVWFRLGEEGADPRLPVKDGYVDLAKLSEDQLIPLRTRMQMIFQDPFSSLNPRMTVRDIVGEPMLIHKICKGSELEDRISDMLTKVGLKPEHRTRYPHAFSGGQRQRIGIARALMMNPSLVVCDEAVSALDVSVQAQVINLLQDLQAEMGLTYIFIAHNLDVVRHICDRIAVMYAGRIVELAKTEDIFKHPQHPYTRLLLSAVPNPDPDTPMNMDFTGEVADPGNLPQGCAFAPRCPLCTEICKHDTPSLLNVSKDRYSACHHSDQLF